MTAKVGFRVPFEEAIAWAEKRVSVMPEEYYTALPLSSRSRAFTVSGLAALDQIHQVKASLANAIIEGQTFAQWQAIASETLGELSPQRQELIFRNAIQTSYAAGRAKHQQMAAGARPYLMYSAINDSRTRDAHAAMDGHIAPQDDPIWQRWTPPNGHNCRCSIISLTKDQAHARGYGEQQTPNVQPDSGWEYHPAQQEERLEKLWDRQRNSATPAVRSAMDQSRKPLVERIDFKDNSQTETLLKTLADERPEWFPHGVKRVTIDPDERAYASVLFGEFTLNNQTIAGFNMAESFQGAILALRNKAPLTKHHEYAIETLWHELIHSRQKHMLAMAAIPANETRMRLIEGSVQYVARHTYGELLHALGRVAPQHQADIIKLGYGNQSTVERLHQISNALGAPSLPIAQMRQLLFEEHPDDFSAKLIKTIAKHAKPHKVNDIQYAIEQFNSGGVLWKNALRRLEK